MEFPMASALFESKGSTGIEAGVLPVGVRTWREVGWIFREGQILAIERRGGQTRVRETLL
jgi:hypothetical protein